MLGASLKGVPPHLERLLHLSGTEEPEVAAVLRAGAVRHLRGEIGEGHGTGLDLLAVRLELIERRSLGALGDDRAVGVAPGRGAT
jgi:hypothetical protein